MSQQGTVSIPLIPKEIVKRIKEQAKNLEELVTAKMKKQYYESILQSFGETQVPKSIEDRALEEVESALIKGLKLQAFMKGLGISREEEREEPKVESKQVQVERVKTEEEVAAEIIGRLVKEGMKPEDATKVAFRILSRGKEEGMSLNEIAQSYRELLKDVMEISKFKFEMLKEDLERLKQGSGDESGIVQYLMSELEELRKANEELKRLMLEKEREEERKRYEQQIEALRQEIESLREALAERKGPISEAMSQYIEELVNRIEDAKKMMEILGYKVVEPKSVGEVLESKKEMELRREIERLRKEITELREKTSLSQHFGEFLKTTLELAFKDPARFRQFVDTLKDLFGAFRGQEAGTPVAPPAPVQTGGGGELFSISPDIFEKLGEGAGGKAPPKPEKKPSKIQIDWGEQAKKGGG